MTPSFAVIAATLAASTVAAAQPVRHPDATSCRVDIVAAPAEVRAEIETWVVAEPRCRMPLEVRVVPIEGGFQLSAHDREGGLRERVVPDARSAAALVASWIADALAVVEPVAIDPAPIVAPPPPAIRAPEAFDVDDLVQATFIAAFDSAKSFHGPVLRNWIFGIATNVVRSYIRRDVARRRTIHALEACEVEVVAAPESERDLERLREAIAALPHKLREAIVLVDLQGDRGVDVAAGLGVPEGTLWRRLHDARARIRVALGGVP